MARTGRPRAFDESQALERALMLFWSRGYGATSVQDLVEALSLERGSLYGAFGDKRSFYLAAVRLYWDTYERSLTAALREGPALPALREVLVTPARTPEDTPDAPPWMHDRQHHRRARPAGRRGPRGRGPRARAVHRDRRRRPAARAGRGRGHHGRHPRGPGAAPALHRAGPLPGLPRGVDQAAALAAADALIDALRA
ncbi:helix-turn-helix domain-containing protein [Nonomuraea salmonea]|uniref:TetR/AcrR family transcriptional regulator n=1 Tax=Nonomuraea salmonea TaxID=46181 RepID=UPI0031ECD669